MQRYSLVFIISLLVFAQADGNSPGITITWEPSDWTASEAGQMWEPRLTTNPIQRYTSHQTLMGHGENPIPNSGDLCVDFARQMIPHHWAAIVMAMDNANIASSDSTITPIARNIATTQSQQLGQFLSWLDNQGIPWMGANFWTWVPNTGAIASQWSKNIPNSDFAGYLAKMNSGMGGTTLIGDLNLDLARQMIPHHWAAIEMATDVIKEGNCDSDIAGLAKNIVKTQKQQLKKFKAWLVQVGWTWNGKDWQPNPSTGRNLRGIE